MAPSTHGRLDVSFSGWPDELDTNPFLRYNNEAIRNNIGMDTTVDSAEVFGKITKLKEPGACSNGWHPPVLSAFSSPSQLLTVPNRSKFPLCSLLRSSRRGIQRRCARSTELHTAEEDLPETRMDNESGMDWVCQECLEVVVPRWGSLKGSIFLSLFSVLCILVIYIYIYILYIILYV